jgi:hypothetical protein
VVQPAGVVATSGLSAAAKHQEFVQLAPLDVEGGILPCGPVAAVVRFSLEASKALQEESSEQGPTPASDSFECDKGSIALRMHRAIDSALPEQLAHAAAAALAALHLRRLLRPGQRQSLAAAALAWMLGAVLVACGWLAFFPLLSLLMG